MTGSDAKLTRCLSLVAERSGLGDWREWTKRDYEQLSVLIGQSTGILLSTSTLIRLFKETPGHNPQKVTLDALARYIGFESWHAFSTGADITHPKVSSGYPQPGRKWRFSGFLYLAGVALVLTVVYLSIQALFFKQRINPDKVRFEIINREITGVPATVQIEYDLGKFRPAKLWLQQYWNPEESVMLNPDQKRTSAIYCYPGVHVCRLIADDQVIGKQKVYIRTTDWTALIRHSGLQLIPLFVRNRTIRHDGVLQVTEPMVNTQNLEPNREILTSYYYVNDLGPVFSDDYTISGIVSNPPTTLGTQPCGYCTVMIIGENGKHFFTIGDPGCSAIFKLDFSGSDTMKDYPDLTAFECLSKGWTSFRSVVSGNTVSVYVGQSLIFTSDQVNNVGQIKGIHVSFSGLGAIDQIRLDNSKGYVAMDENFD